MSEVAVALAVAVVALCALAFNVGAAFECRRCALRAEAALARIQRRA